MNVRIFEFFEGTGRAEDEINSWLEVEKLKSEDIICIKQSESVDNSNDPNAWNLTISIWYT